MQKWAILLAAALLVGCKPPNPYDPALMEFGRTISQGSPDQVAKLIDQGQDPDGSLPVGNGSPMHIAAVRGDVAILDVLVKRGASVDRVGGDFGDATPLWSAARAGKIDAIRFLLSNGANPNGNSPKGPPPLGYAANLDVAKELISHGADPNARDNYGTRAVDLLAYSDQKLPAAEYAIQHGGKPESFGRAIERDDPKLASHFLSLGANINSRSKWGAGTPLHFAAMHGSSKVASFLAANGADLEAHDEYGYRPLDDAIARGKTATAKALVVAGTKINGTGSIGRTALHLACSEGNLEMVKTLVEKGADVNARDIHGWTPLFRAGTTGRIEIIKYLLQSGADPRAKDELGKTAGEWATKLKQPNAAALLDKEARN